MELTHKLTYDGDNFVIDEPIGYDDLQMTMQRHDYHGIGAEVSLGNLEFYGQAFDIIKEAYDTDIDSDVTYTILMDNNEVLYSGKVDLSTCSFLRGDYQSVKVKVGEVGTKTTFNNRVDVDVDLTDPKTVDGASVNDVEWLNVHIPLKHLLYTNASEQKEDVTITQAGGRQPHPETGVYIANYTSQYQSYDSPYLFLPLGDVTTNEFGNFGVSQPYGTYDPDLVDPQYIASEDHETKFGSNTVAQVDIVFNAKAINKNFITYADDGYIRWHLEAVDADGNVIVGEEKKVKKSDVHTVDSEWDLSCELHGQLNAGGSIKYYIKFDIDLGDYTGQYIYIHIDLHKGTSVKMTMYDTLEEDEPVNADMILVHDTLNVVSHAISENELSVKSDWYRTYDSQWNAGATGDGALKALTNGYHIRDLFTDDYNKRNMPVSFKELIESLDALDCIGWGFSSEDNVLYIRVERWDWFYKDTTILTLTNVAEVTTDVYTDRIPTELSIGYKKYATSDEYNSIESPHGTRKFTSGIKAVTKAVTKECDFVADNYAIEETRRAKTQKKKNEESTYDENIFVFELQCYRDLDIQDPQPPVYSIAHTAVNAQEVGRANEFINAKLTPRHMAARWRDYIFSAHSSLPFKFTSGTINYKASFGTIPEDQQGALQTEYLASKAITSPQVENSDVTCQHAKFKAEKITFSCPISLAQYRAVKANPYGLVSVNGVLGWIMDFKYKMQDGMADFTLIAKN